jgi:hypothetical protein
LAPEVSARPAVYTGKTRLGRSRVGRRRLTFNLAGLHRLQGDLAMTTKIRIALGLALTIALATAAPTFATAPTSRSNLVGTWVNVNPATTGIVKVVITNDIFGFRIHTYGACSPTPCDHGSIVASPFSKSVTSSVATGLSAIYDHGFVKVLVTAKRTAEYDGGNYLELETRSAFAPGDTRFDYTRTELFRKP